MQELGLDAVSRPELSDEGAGTLPDALEGMVFERQGVDTALLLQMIPEKARDRELVLKQLLHYVGILLGTKKKKKVGHSVVVSLFPNGRTQSWFLFLI